MERVKEKEKEFRKGDWGVKYLFRGPRLDLGIILLKPNTELGRHLHREVEESFYIVEGKVWVEVGGKGFSLEKGEAIRVEPGEIHNLRCRESEEAKIVFIKCPYLPQDKVEV